MQWSVLALTPWEVIRIVNRTKAAAANLWLIVDSQSIVEHEEKGSSLLFPPPLCVDFSVSPSQICHCIDNYRQGTLHKK